ncbi:MAG TPA: hypothetical protein VF914_14090 [Chloroflexia bacterium]|jgi:hypothetical protein
MSREGQLRKSLARLSRARDTVERSLKQAARTAKRPGQRNINLASRVNKAVTTDIGETDTVRGASSRQSVRIAQGPGGTGQVSDTKSVQVSHEQHT